MQYFYARGAAVPNPGYSLERTVFFYECNISMQEALQFQIQRRYNMHGRSQMQGGKNWILPKEINTNRFF
jgi:hypothetical protein